jgi:uncharacterized protein YjbJ (UPF0337 family)
MGGDSDITAGMADKAKGRVKKAAGDLTGNQDLKDRGAGDEAKGSMKKGLGRVKNASHDLTT